MQPPLPGALAAACEGIAMGMAIPAATPIPAAASADAAPSSEPRTYSHGAYVRDALSPPPQAQLPVDVDPLSVVDNTRLDALSMVGQAASGASLPLTRVSLRKDDAEPSIDDLEDHDAEPQATKY